MKSRVITVSAISAGLVAICLAIGIYVEIVDLFSLVLSSVFVILPLYLKSYKGALFTYLAGGVLGLLIGWFNFVYSFVFPAYFAFFGLFPIIACLLREKKINKFFYHTIGLIWGLAAAYGLYFYYTLVMRLDFANLPHYLIWIKDYLIVVVGVVGVVFYFVYERFITLAKTLIDKYMGKIIK